MYLLTVNQIELLRVQFPTAMSDTKSLNISMFEVMISSNNERVLIHDWSKLTFQKILDAWWASMNEDSKSPIDWNNYRLAPSWRFYLQCGIEKTGGPGIISIVCHQVLRHPSENGTNWMGKHLLANAHIANCNKLTVSEVTESTSSTIDEPALAIRMWQGCWGNLILSLQKTFKFTIQVFSILTELTVKML